MMMMQMDQLVALAEQLSAEELRAAEEAATPK
jgi:hypothetical protein